MMLNNGTNRKSFKTSRKDLEVFQSLSETFTFKTSAVAGSIAPKIAFYTLLPDHFSPIFENTVAIFSNDQMIAINIPYKLQTQLNTPYYYNIFLKKIFCLYEIRLLFFKICSGYCCRYGLTKRLNLRQLIIFRSSRRYLIVAFYLNL